MTIDCGHFQFYRVPLAELYVLLINTIEKLHLINSEVNLLSPQHLKWLYFSGWGIFHFPWEHISSGQFSQFSRGHFSRHLNIIAYCQQNWYVRLAIYTDLFTLRIHWRLSTILKTSKKVYEVMFFDMLKYVYSVSVFNALYIEIKQKC